MNDDDDQMASDRLSIFLEGSRPSISVGPIDVQAASLGSPEDWTWTAVSYLKCKLSGTMGGAQGGTVEVSAAAVGIVLGHVEQLAMDLGVIGAPTGATVGEAATTDDAWSAAAAQAGKFVELVAVAEPTSGNVLDHAIVSTAQKIAAEIRRERDGTSRSGIPMTRLHP